MVMRRSEFLRRFSWFTEEMTMTFLEKYRDHSLIAKIFAYVMFLDAGTSILGMFIKMIR